MSSPQHPVNRNIAQSMERDSMRAICRIIWLVLCVALICAALPVRLAFATSEWVSIGLTGNTVVWRAKPRRNRWLP